MGLEFDEGTYKETLEMAVKAVDVPAFRKRQKRRARTKAVTSRHRLCNFFGAYRLRQPGIRGTRDGNHARVGRLVIVSVDPSGFVEARIGSSPHGQGLRTTLAQIIADELGIAPAMIRVVHGDTDRRTLWMGAPLPADLW